MPDNLPNWDESGFKMSDDEMMCRMRGLVDLTISRNHLLGLPTAQYDGEKDLHYLEYPDGRREDVT